MLEIGSHIDGKYKILNKIGQGGMSVVYLAMNEKANKQWAIKEVRKDVDNFQSFAKGLLAETELLKKLNHRNLPSIVDVIDYAGDTFLIVMDYIEGHPLSQVLEEFGAQPQEKVIEWAKQLCDVLGYLHNRKPPIIYRDIKPANVMLKPDGDLALIDFGTAREFKDRNVADTMCLGTVGYAAPEQFGGQGQTDARTDIYSLGVLLYHLVTGLNPTEPPYEIRPIRTVNPLLSKGLEWIIGRCTMRNPDDRFQSCAELMYALEHCEEMDDSHGRKLKIRLGICAAALVMALALAGVALFSHTAGNTARLDYYKITLIEASNVQKTREERIGLYTRAITINPSDPVAWKDMIGFFLADNGLVSSGNTDDGSLTIQDSGAITQLKAGIDIIGENGYTKTVYPLDVLRSKNRAGYEEVCYEIGLAYWYHYVNQNERYASAVEWFQQAADSYPIAKIYCDIGECHIRIRRFSGQGRIEDMNKAYAGLWGNLVILKSAAASTPEVDTKILVWREIVSTVSDKVAYFLGDEVGKSDMSAFLNDIAAEAAPLLENARMKDPVQDVLDSIETAKQRIDSV